ncbi:MAG: DNA repair protein RadC [Elusimicrobia bacterium]|nr:DNA repair protein RadC [Elusimicrobiota bacterium]
MRLHDLHRVQRPREKLASRTAEALSDEELLALLLRTGYRGRGVLELSSALLKAFPGGLDRAAFDELASIKGMGPSRAAAVVACFELGRRWLGRLDHRPVLDRPENVMAQIPPVVLGGRKEHFLAFYLNARGQLIQKETVSIGTLSASLVHPREVFAPAIGCGAASVIAAHNHPSGDCSPSNEDRDATRRLVRGGELLGIPLLDHLVVSGSGFFSFKENGLI